MTVVIWDEGTWDQRSPICGCSVNMLVYFVRHGEVENPESIKYGRLPGFPLSEVGREEIGKTAAELVDKNIKVIYSSSLLRTKQSAELIETKLKVPLYFDDRLLEFDCGQYQGISEKEYKEKELWRFGGETLEQSGDRIIDFLNFVKSENKYKTIAVVSHEGPIVMALLNRTGKAVDDYDSIKLPTGGIIKYTF